MPRKRYRQRPHSPISNHPDFYRMTPASAARAGHPTARVADGLRLSRPGGTPFTTGATKRHNTRSPQAVPPLRRAPFKRRRSTPLTRRSKATWSAYAQPTQTPLRSPVCR